MIKDEEPWHAMDGALPPYDGGDDGDVVPGEAFQNPTLIINDGEHAAMGAPLPPDDCDGAEGGRSEGKAARSPTTWARAVLAIGLLLEMSATFWAFSQAISAGALNRDVDCGNDSRISKLYASYIIKDGCDEQIDADVFYNFTTYWGPSFSDWDEYVACDSPTNTIATVRDFRKFCSCPADLGSLELTSCSWVALLSPLDSVCYAQGVFTSGSDGSVIGILDTYPFFNECWATNPSGTVALTISALVVALSSQLLEAVVGFKYWKHTQKRAAAFTLAASVFEALGVVAVSSVLLSLPGFYGVSDDTSNRLPVLFWLAWTGIPIVVVGALGEATAECSDRAAGRFPYLSAVGNGLIWLGAALLEVVVTSYLLWTGGGIKDAAELAREAAGLFALELLALVAMWTARVLWTRAKLLSASVNILQGPLRIGIRSMCFGR